MELFVRLSVMIISILFLTNYDMIYKIIDKHNLYHKYQRILFIVFTFVVIVGNGYLIIIEMLNSNSEKNNITGKLTSIQNAIAKANLHYDTVSNSIIIPNNNVYQGSGLAIAGNNATANNVTVLTHYYSSKSDTLFFKIPSKQQLQKLISNIFILSNKIHTKNVLVYTLYPAVKFQTVNAVINIIRENKFTIVDQRIFDPGPSGSKIKRTYVVRRNKSIAVFIGEFNQNNYPSIAAYDEQK